ncbi:MAG: tetratricopeptide repeat protein, partial [Spongiibacteraceae bacterium]
MLKSTARIFSCRLLACMIGCAGAAVCSADDDAALMPRTVQDLRYGVVLYDFFQDDYFQALTELMLGEQKQDMPHHAEFASLLRGGISLSYGMDDQSRAIFNQLLAQHPKADVRDRAWFYLGKSFYQRGDYVSAADMLSRSGDQLPSALGDERDYLRTLISLKSGALKSGDTSGIVVTEKTQNNPWLPYLLYNLGVVQAAAGDTASAAATLDRLALLPLTQPEHKALRDRAFTAAGYNYLNANDSERALGVLSKVRLNSPLSDKALLGYGWAHAQRKDFAAALGPWQTLTQRSALLPAVQEGLLAVPYAYEQLQAPAQALEEYTRAEQVLMQEMQRVEAAEKTLQTASLLGLWIDTSDNKATSREWQSRNAELPLQPQVPYLEHLLARNDIQEIIKDMRDLRLLETYLGDWIDRLDALYTAQSLQHQRRQQLLKDRPDQALLKHYDELIAQRNAANTQLQDAVARGDSAPLMTTEEIAAAKRLERVRLNIETLRAAGKNVDVEAEKYRRLRGALAWQVQDDFTARRWTATKALRDLDTELAQSERNQQRLATLVDRARQPERGEHIHALVARLEALLKNIRGAQGNGEITLRQLSLEEMQQQRLRLQVYLGKTRLAMARLYDLGETKAATDAPRAKVNGEK